MDLKESAKGPKQKELELEKNLCLVLLATFYYDPNVYRNISVLLGS